MRSGWVSLCGVLAMVCAVQATYTYYCEYLDLSTFFILLVLGGKSKMMHLKMLFWVFHGSVQG